MSRQIFKYLIPIYIVWMMIDIYLFFKLVFLKVLLFQISEVMPDFSSAIPVIISHVLLTMIGLAFMIYMLVDCADRKFNENSQKVIWILVIIFLNVVGAIIYYYVHGKDSGNG